MKKKKLLALLLAASMATTCFAFAACGEKDDTDDNKQQTEQGGNQGGNQEGGNQEGGNENDENNEKLSAASQTLTNQTVYVVGDSTVDSSFSDKYYQPRVGYGGAIADYLDLGTGATVKNLAVSGRSSYSYMIDSATNYNTIKNGIKAGDYLVIGFGHNDEKAEAARYANPNLEYTDSSNLSGTTRAESFQYILYNYYVKLAKDAGATPILCTPIVRLSTGDSYSGQHVTTTSTVSGVEYAGGDYGAAIRKLGEATNTTVVDMLALTAADYAAVKYNEAAYYHAWTKEDIGSVDKTHTSIYGARMNAYHFAKAIKLSDNPLSAYVKANPAKPDKATGISDGINLGVKNGYVLTEYHAPTTTSTIWTTVKKDGWKGTVFGDVGGQDKITTSNYTVQQVGDDFKVGNQSETLRGKISGSSDGVAAVYMQLDKFQNFKIEATVTINTYNADAKNNQQGYGIMLRDDMYVDTNDTTVSSNYISAGWYGKQDGGNVIYMRKNGTLEASGKTGTVAVNDTHTLSIQKENQTFTVTFDGYTEQGMFTDLSLVGIDNDYIYICLYATRGIVATFSNVVYTDLGMGTDA